MLGKKVICKQVGKKDTPIAHSYLFFLLIFFVIMKLSCELDYTTFRGPFQVKPFYDSIGKFRNFIG